jgi:HD superfamily phosphohydrolase
MRESIESWLESEYTEAERDPLWGHVYLSPAFKRITETAPFSRLSRIRQLGPTWLVYPGATHTRALHSLGVFHVAKRLLCALLRRPGMPDITREEAASFLAAALLHDLGHFPYTHALKELALKSHEALTAESVLSDELASPLRQAGADPELVAAIVDKDRPAAGNALFFRGILSGTLDPDKLDYLNRDAYFCGVPYGCQDIDFILSRVYPDKAAGISIDPKGMTSIDHLLFSKYLMYSAVYWHRDVRAATAMVKQGLSAALSRGLLAAEELYRLDDESFRDLLSAFPRPELRAAQEVFAGRVYPCQLELAYEGNKPAHAALNAQAGREALASRLRELSFSRGAPADIDLIVDLPEDISFESSVALREAAYAPRPSVFTSAVVEGFTRSLRFIRVYASAPARLEAADLG